MRKVPVGVVCSGLAPLVQSIARTGFHLPPTDLYAVTTLVRVLTFRRYFELFARMRSAENPISRIVRITATAVAAICQSNLFNYQIGRASCRERV